jgi:hypothetical protein
MHDAIIGLASVVKSRINHNHCHPVKYRSKSLRGAENSRIETNPLEIPISHTNGAENDFKTV